MPQPNIKAIGYIDFVDPKVSVCCDCGTCELVCALAHSGACGPNLRRIWLERNPFEGHYEILTCRQCSPAQCVEACPTGALYVDEKTGIKVINEEECIGCGACVDACVMESSRINFDPVKNVALKCDLCEDRPNGPECVRQCPNVCLEVVKA